MIKILFNLKIQIQNTDQFDAEPFVQKFLADDNNFVDFEEYLGPTLLKSKTGIHAFTRLRNVLGNNTRNASAAPALNQLERLNVHISLTAQRRELQDVNSDTFLIREKVDNLAQNFSNHQTELTIELNDLFRTLKDHISAVERTVDTLTQNVNELLQILQRLDQRVTQIINFYDNLHQLINDHFSNLNSSLDTLFSNVRLQIHELLHSINQSMQNIFDAFLTTLKRYIMNKRVRQTTQLTTILTEALIGQTTAIVTAVEASFITKVQTLTAATLAGIELAFTGQTTTIKSVIPNKTKIITSQIKKFYDYVSDFFENKFNEQIKQVVETWFEENQNTIFNNVSKYLSERIVGESYLRYDSNSTYSPSLHLKFKTKFREDARRTSQIKLRFNYPTDQIDAAHLEQLRKQVASLNNLTYVAGKIRCNYVAEKRLFKTTIFSDSEQTVKDLLRQLIPLTNTQYIEENISFTFNSKRDHDIKRKKSLDNVIVNPPVLHRPVEMILSSAYLQVNGLEHQLTLF